MTNKLPEALRLAVALENSPLTAGLSTVHEAAALLRTQHALLERAAKILKRLHVDPENFDFGPAYEMAKRERADTLAALNQHLDKP